MAADCGELVSESEPEPVFDPDLVTVPRGQCTVSPLEIEPPADVSLSATVVNDNEMMVLTTVEWTWRGSRLRIGQAEVPANSQARIQESATIEDEGRGQVRAEVIRASPEGPSFAPMSPGQQRNERVRAGAPNEDNGQHRPVADGGVNARAALARACGGCAERSRKLSATNRRLRNAFSVFGRRA